MRNQILENKEFNIISRSIDNATTCSVVDVNEDCFTVKLHKNYTQTNKCTQKLLKSKLNLWFSLPYYCA